MNLAVTTWTEALDAYEESLVQHSLLLTGAEPLTGAQPTSTPWDTLARPSTPLPPELAERARALHDRGDALATQIAERLRDRPARRVDRSRPDRRRPSVLDVEA